MKQFLKELFCFHKYEPDEYRDKNGEWQDCLTCIKCFKMKFFEEGRMINFKYSIQKKKQNFSIWFARKFPYIALWCFIVVIGDDGDCPTSGYTEKYNYWVKKYKIKNM